jgi:hypothetical protein
MMRSENKVDAVRAERKRGIKCGCDTKRQGRRLWLKFCIDEKKGTMYTKNDA